MKPLKSVANCGILLDVVAGETPSCDGAATSMQHKSSRSAATPRRWCDRVILNSLLHHASIILSRFGAFSFDSRFRVRRGRDVEETVSDENGTVCDARRPQALPRVEAWSYLRCIEPQLSRRHSACDRPIRLIRSEHAIGRRLSSDSFRSWADSRVFPQPARGCCYRPRTPSCRSSVTVDRLLGVCPRNNVLNDMRH